MHGVAQGRTWHVDARHPDATDDNTGTPDAPLRTINAAAERAQAGDRVLVQPGVYREWVSPARSGTAGRPIVYEAAKARQVFVRGSEVWTPKWEPVSGRNGVFRAPLDDAMFDGLPYPPYEALANRRQRYPHEFPLPESFWRARPIEAKIASASQANASEEKNRELFITEGPGAVHWPRTMGQVFLNGEMLEQVESMEDVTRRPGSWIASADGKAVLLHVPRGVEHPAEALVELSVRHRVFGAKRRGLGHIVVRGFVIEHAANHAPWPQAGMVSTRSGHHYTFENNVIRHARTVGLDIGREWKPASVERKSDAVNALDGTPRGHHRIVGNLIAENGSAGIIGWGGNPGTVIARNVIERNNYRGTSTVEEGGIKIHGSQGMLIEQNLVRDNDAAGIWLDTGYAGARVTRNVVIGNVTGIFVELGHGRVVVDHNVCADNIDGIYAHDASDVVIAHNLLATNAHYGVYTRQVSDRSYSNPDHRADPTQPERRGAGSARHRVVNNLFVDNYRGAICMGWPGETTGGSFSNGNVFTNGRQWQWNGFERVPMFALDPNEGRTTDALIESTFRRALETQGQDDPSDAIVASRVDAKLLSLEEWRAVTGWDADSVVVEAQKAPDVSPLRPKFTLKLNDRAFFDAACEPVEGLRQDFFGRPLGRGPLLPGPFQDVIAGETEEELRDKRAKVNTWLLWPPVDLEATHTDASEQDTKMPLTVSPPTVIPLDIPAPADTRGGLIAADLTGDGRRALIVTTPGHLTAVTPDGQRLWTIRADIRLASKSEDNGLPGHHGSGVQAGDIDGDGKIEVLFMTFEGELRVHDGSTGEFRWSATPAPPPEAFQWEQPIIANLRGLGDRDILLQACDDGEGRRGGYRVARHLVAYAAEELQKQQPEPMWQRDDFFGVNHGSARIADLDLDGRDEIVGGMILSPEGEPLFSVPVEANLRTPHIDSVFVDYVLPDRDTPQVVALEEAGENRVFLYDHNGLIWQTHHQHMEPQNAGLARPDDYDQQGMLIWCRSRINEHQQPFVFNAQGELVHTYEMDEVAPADWTVRGLETIVSIHWDGTGAQLLAAKERHTSGDVCLFDPATGEFRLRLPEAADRLYVADVTGDWREELIVQAGSELRIYQNPSANPNPERPRLWTMNHYRRSKSTWNYYSP